MPSPTSEDPLRLLRHPWRAARRRVLLHRRGLAALLLAAAVASALQAVRAPVEATVPVWVAAHDLDGGGVLGSQDLRRVALPRDAVPSGTVGHAALEGRRLAGPVRAGEPLTDRRVLGADLLAAYPGRVAVPVRLADPGAAALLHTGDRVDLVRLDPQGDRAGELLASRAAVLARVREAAGEGLTSSATGTGGLVLVAVDPVAAADVAAAGASGYLAVTLPG